MDKWYISDNGRVAGPLNVNDVQRLIAKNSDLYGWNPSFSHWLPIEKIQELKGFLPEDYSSDRISKELIDRFVTKKRDLNKKTALINASIEATVQKMAIFEEEISNYKTLTTALSPDVQENIVPLEKKYNSIGKQLNDLLKALAISKEEINEVVKEFGGMVLNKSTESYENFSELTETTPIKTVAPVKASTPSKPSAAVETTTSTPQSTPTKPVVAAEATKPIRPVERNIPKESAEVVTREPEKVEDNKPASSNINMNVPLEFRGTVVNCGTNSKPSVVPIRKEQTADNQSGQSTLTEKMDFKSKLKSVFSKPNSDEDLGKLSDRLRLLEKESTKQDVTEEEMVFLDYDVESELDEEGDLKKKHRRRRRV